MAMAAAHSLARYDGLRAASTGTALGCRPACPNGRSGGSGVRCAVRAPKREQDAKKRVVITGMGLVSVFGNDVDTFYDKLLEGTSGIDTIGRFDISKFPTKFAWSD